MRISLCFAIGIFFVTGCSTTGNYISNSFTSSKFIVSKVKRGEACANRILLFGPFGDLSIYRAAKNGKIGKVAFVEQTHQEYGVFGKTCTIAYGN